MANIFQMTFLSATKMFHHISLNEFIVPDQYFSQKSMIRIFLNMI